MTIVRGAGPCFSAGYDLGGGNEGHEMPYYTAGGEGHWPRHVTESWMSIWDLAKPVIAQVHGYCLAGGSELATGCDLVYVAEDAQMGYPAVRFGVPDMHFHAWFLGMRTAMEMMLTGDSISGVEAVRLGWANRAFPAAELDDEVLAVARAHRAAAARHRAAQQARRAPRRWRSWACATPSAPAPSCARSAPSSRACTSSSRSMRAKGLTDGAAGARRALRRLPDRRAGRRRLTLGSGGSSAADRRDWGMAKTSSEKGNHTLSEKVWDRHVVRSAPGEPDLLYIDLHLVHEVTSPQAFDGIRMAGRSVRRPDLTVATADHNVPTENIDQPVEDPISAKQLEVLAANTAEFGITHYGMGDPNQGIVHVIGPEQGRTLPGMTIVCGDSHTSTHGAFGALAFGIGTSEVEHVLATQTLPQQRPGTMAVTVTGELPAGATAKDVILAIIGRIGTGGGIGSVIEYRGDTIAALSMEGRMTICNMSIEAGAKAGLIAPDDVTFAYLEGRAHAPKGAAWEAALDDWRIAAHRRRRRLRQGGAPRRRRHRPARVLGHEPGSGGAARRRHPLARRLRRRQRARQRRPSPRVHGPHRRHAGARRRRRHGVHRAAAPTRASRTCGPRPRWPRAAR